MKLQSMPTPPHTLIYRLTSLTLSLTLIVTILIGTLGEQTSQAKTTGAPSIGGCPLFPPDNIWNRDISTLPVHPNSANFIKSIGVNGHLQPDFGSGLYKGEPIGFPYIVVPGNQLTVPISFDYADESDPGPYPIPTNAPIEGGSQSSGDRHVIIVNSGTCKLYEMFASYPQSNGSWKAGSGAMWNLNSNVLRPKSWTSADAAGLPILPGLVRYDEVAAGAINHALRFTINRMQHAYLWPARHYSSSRTDPNLPPMGLRLRLKASVDISAFSPQSRVILIALKHYGMVVADIGRSWVMSGAPDNRWNNDDLHQLDTISGSDFEVIDESSLQVSPDSGQARASSTSTTSTPRATPTTVQTIVFSPTTTSLPSPTSAPSRATTAESSRPQGGNAGESSIGTLLFFGLGSLGAILVVAIVGVWRRSARKRTT